MKEIEFFTNQKTNLISDGFKFIGGRLHLVIDGKFAGALVKFQVSYDNGKNYHDYLNNNNEAITQTNLGKAFYLVEDDEVKIRAILSNVSNETNLSLRGYYNQYYSPKHNILGLS